MDIMQVLIAAGFGGAFGAVGGVIGHLGGKLLPEKTRQTFMVACVVIAVIGSRYATTDFQTEVYKQQISNAAQTDPLTRLIADNFPDEFSETMNKIAKNPTEEYAIEQGALMSSSLRKENSEHILTASAEKIENFLTSSNNIHRNIRERYGASTCSIYLLAGPAGTPEILENEYAKISEVGSQLFEAILDGRDNPVARDLSTDEDWNQFFSAWISAGGTQRMVDTVKTPSASGDALCDAWISMTETLLSMETSSSDRIKTQLTYVAAAN